MCFAEMFDFTAKQSPASFPAFPEEIRLSISFACSIALGFSSRKMFRSFVFGVAIFFENCIRFFTADNLPSLICLSFVLSVIFSMSLFRLQLSCRR